MALDDEGELARSTPKDILHLSFNQDARCLSVGLRGGYCIYDCLPFAQRFATGGGGIGKVEMLFCSSLVVLVGGGDQPSFSPRRLRLWDTARAAALCELRFDTAVLTVRLNRRRMAVGLERALHVFDVTSMACLQIIETAPNPQPLLALSSNEENCYLAFPCGGGGGEAILFNALTLKVIVKVSAARGPLVAMSFSRDGSLLATASEQGTVIRVFKIPSAQQLCTLRRGSTPTTIHCLAFSASGTRLAVSSASRTVHVFDLTSVATSHRERDRAASGSNGSSRRSSREEEQPHIGDNAYGDGSSGGSKSWGSWRSIGLAGGAKLKQAAAMLPLGKNVADFVDCERSFAVARLPSDPVSTTSTSSSIASTRGLTVCALSQMPEGNGMTGGERLLVATSEGRFLRYRFEDNGGLGGEMRLESDDALIQSTAGEAIGAELYVTPR